MIPKIINIKDVPEKIQESIDYYYRKWGNNNYPFFHDAMIHSSLTPESLPRFYMLLRNEAITGCCALVTNDLISRHDLYPWLAGLFVEKKERGKGLGNFMMQYLEKEVARMNFANVYLTTDHAGYYEKYGWKRIEDGYDIRGNASRIYTKEL